MKKRLIAVLFVFVLSTGLMTELLPREEAKAVLKFLYDKKKPDAILTTKKAKSIFVGGNNIDLGYNIGGKKEGIKGKWSSSNPKVVTVSKKGKLKAVGNGNSIISFKYKQGGKENTIKCKVTAKTRATEVKLISPEAFDGSMDFGNVFSFRAELLTNPKALEINPSINHSYKVFYELFMDENLKNPPPTSLAEIGENGLFKAKSEAGTVYLRAVGKLSKNSKSGVVYSAPLVITIGPKVNLQTAVLRQSALNKIDVTLENADRVTKVLVRDFATNRDIGSTMLPSTDKGSFSVVTSEELRAKTRVLLFAGDKMEEKFLDSSVQRVENIELTGEEAPLISFDNNRGRAEIGFKLLDQFGTDVTNDERFKKKSYAIWQNKKADISEDGRISFDLTPEQSVMGYQGILEVSYVGEYPSVDRSFAVRIGTFRVAKEIKVEGIYKKLTTGYVKVMGKDGSLPVGTTLAPHMTTVLQDNYAPHYLLISVKDNTGQSMAEKGADSKRYEVSVLSSTGLELDKLQGNEVKSVDPVVIGGERFLAYPLKAAVLKEGEVVIQAGISGTRIKDFMSGKVSKMAGSGSLELSGEGFVNEENLISFVLKNATGEVVKKYEEVLGTLGLIDHGVGTVFILPDSKLIYSEKSSIFQLKKNLSTGEAELYYKPFSHVLPPNTKQFIEEVTVFKGSSNEDKWVLKVKSR